MPPAGHFCCAAWDGPEKNDRCQGGWARKGMAEKCHFEAKALSHFSAIHFLPRRN
jgi:hypothetical protein